MRTATLCTLCATLATVSFSYNQVNAATLTVHTDVPAVKVHVPPPKVTVHPLSPKVQVHKVTVRDAASGMATGKRMHKPLGVSAYDKKTDKSKGPVKPNASEIPQESLQLNYGGPTIPYTPQ